MQCPKCGRELETGSIYCKACGREQQIVPDYDPLDELRIGQEPPCKERKEKEKQQVQSAKKPKSLPKVFWMLGFLLVGFFIFLIAYFSIRRENNYSYQLRKGISLVEKEQYEEAISCLKQAKELQAEMEGADIQPLRYLAYAYAQIDSPEMALTCMEDAVAMEDAARGNTEVLEELYLEFMEILNRTRQTGKIEEVIEACPYREIQELLRPYRIGKPSCDTPEGEYGYYLNLELFADYGTVYYTLDGTEPTDASTRYEEPISLGEGETLLTAVAINSKGMVSDKLVLVYKLNFDKNPIEESEEEATW